MYFLLWDFLFFYTGAQGTSGCKSPKTCTSGRTSLMAPSLPRPRAPARSLSPTSSSHSPWSISGFMLAHTTAMGQDWSSSMSTALKTAANAEEKILISSLCVCYFDYLLVEGEIHLCNSAMSRLSLTLRHLFHFFIFLNFNLYFSTFIDAQSLLPIFFGLSMSFTCKLGRRHSLGWKGFLEKVLIFILFESHIMHSCRNKQNYRISWVSLCILFASYYGLGIW